MDERIAKEGNDDDGKGQKEAHWASKTADPLPVRHDDGTVHWQGENTPPMASPQKAPNRERPMLVFSFDFKPEHIAAFYFLHEALDAKTAARLIMTAWDQFPGGAEQLAIFNFARQHPSEAMIF